MKAAIETEAAATAGTSYLSFFRTRGNKKRLYLLLCIGFYSQWVGNGVISYYLPQILTTVGITTASAQTGLNGGLSIWSWFAGESACHGHTVILLSKEQQRLILLILLFPRSYIRRHDVRALGPSYPMVGVLLRLFGFLHPHHGLLGLVRRKGRHCRRQSYDRLYLHGKHLLGSCYREAHTAVLIRTDVI